MSAEILRRAASLMRERAVNAEEYAFLSPNDMSGWACDGSWIQPEDELISEHYAALSPAVALAVADWLDKIAGEGHEGDGPNGCADCDPAFAVARAYLGESA